MLCKFDRCSVLSFSAVCTVDHDTFKTFDDVEFQYSLPDRCMHVLTKDCSKNNTFMVLVSKETEKPDKKIIEIFVEKQKIRIEHLNDGRYQIQVGLVFLLLSNLSFSHAERPPKKSKHVV